MKTLLHLLLGIVTFGLGCATHVGIAATHREDISAQARIFAIAARNLEDGTRGHGGSPAEQAAAQNISVLHTAAEHFARDSARWSSDDIVNTRYEELIRAWVTVKQTFPDIKGDAQVEESFKRVSYEYEKLARSTGYSNKKYEKSLEKK